jgi:hypothetical protein
MTFWSKRTSTPLPSVPYTPSSHPSATVISLGHHTMPRAQDSAGHKVVLTEHCLGEQRSLVWEAWGTPSPTISHQALRPLVQHALTFAQSPPISPSSLSLSPIPTLSTYKIFCSDLQDLVHSPSWGSLHMGRNGTFQVPLFFISFIPTGQHCARSAHGRCLMNMHGTISYYCFMLYLVSILHCNVMFYTGYVHIVGKVYCVCAHPVAPGKVSIDCVHIMGYIQCMCVHRVGSMCYAEYL